MMGRDNLVTRFNPTTSISYSLPEHNRVKLTVLDIRGRELMILQDAFKLRGNNTALWNGVDRDGNQVVTGVYLCRLSAGSQSQTIKMVYLR